MKYRLYIDEVGNSDLESSKNPNERFLSLTGIIIELDYVSKILNQELEDIKRRYFSNHYHPDEPLILHRKELVNKNYPFEALQSPNVESRFNLDILDGIKRWEYVVITVTIDKLEHVERYKIWRYDPYHYCLKILLERYVLWLSSVNGIGDVMAESRNGYLDKRLKNSFERVYQEGTEHVPPDKFHARLTSKQLKVKPKANNISGLQLADLIAHPSYKAALARKNKVPLPDNFGGQIAKILYESKYHRNFDGKVDGWGLKWLP